MISAAPPITGDAADFCLLSEKGGNRMYGIVKIGEKEVPMMAMASTDYYFKNVFGDDLLKKMSDKELPVSDMIDTVLKLGFIMAKFAELKTRKEMLKLNMDAFFEWLDEIPHEDVYDDDTLVAIQDIYQGNKKTTSEVKNQDDQ